MVRAGHEQPELVLTSPGAGIIFQRGAVLNLTAEVRYANQADVVMVTFLVDEVEVGRDARYPFAVTWPNATLGSHRLTAVATLRSGPGSPLPATVAATERIFTVIDVTRQGVLP